MNRPPNAVSRDIATAARGLAMGAADVVPGVSGGTIALVLGIYERLVTAISHFDARLLGHLRRCEFVPAAHHVDLRFLVALGLGIATSIVGLSKLMNGLLSDDQTRPLTLAAFFGLILASTVVVARMAKLNRRRDLLATWLLAGGGAVFAYWLTGLRPFEAEPSYAYVFFGGTVAICAMILPGISGAFILLILGLYVYLTGIIGRLAHLDVGGGELLSVGVFLAGCALGLISFSKLLRWLLARHESATMGVLCGFMVGSLRKIWPFQRDVTLANLDRVGLPPETVERIRTAPDSVAQMELVREQGIQHRLFANEFPRSLDATVLAIVLIAGTAFALVLIVQRLAARRTRGQLLEATDHLTPDEEEDREQGER